MELETQLSIQALIDGELSGEKQCDVERLVKADAEAKALHDELSRTADALKTNESLRELPETRDFFWSKIAAEIELEDRKAESAQNRPRAAWWTRLLAPIGAAAALVIAFTLFQGESPISQQSKGVAPVVGNETLAETELEMPDSFTFYLHEQDTTVIWVDSNVEIK